MRKLLFVGLWAVLATTAWGPTAFGDFKTDEKADKKYDNIQGPITSIADGDTVRVRSGKQEFRIRMLGIDTPEKNYNGKSQGKWAELAHEHLLKLVPVGTVVRIEVNPAEPTDKYGRVLGHVWLGKENINVRMASDCMAVNYCIYPNTLHCEELTRVVERCYRDKKGIFSDSDVEVPYEWRRRVSRRPNDRYVGNIDTFEVFGPEAEQAVPVPQRVFFPTVNDVEPPYHLVGE